MIFRNYLEKILGSKVKVRIVRAMFRFPSKSFTARELATYIKVSHTPVLRSLSDLVGMNLVVVEKHGASNLIKLNKNSHLYGPLGYLFNFEKNAKEKLISKIKRIIPNAEMVVLFGSIQEGKEKMDSDIDILIVTDNKEEINNSLIKKQNLIIREFGNVLSTIILTKKQFISKKNKSFARDLIKNYKLIVGKDLIEKYWKCLIHLR